MKKLFLCLLLLLCLAGCSPVNNEISEGDLMRYKDFIHLIENNGDFVEQSEFFDFEVVTEKIDSGYSFYLIIDNPRYAMYHVGAVAIIDGHDYQNEMAPNVGIFGTETYNLIPNQSNVKNGYYKGILLNGLSSKESFDLKFVVSWTNNKHDQLSYVYGIVHVNNETVNEEN